MLIIGLLDGSSGIWAAWHILHPFISYLLPLLEVFLNLALLATCLCLCLPKHLSACLSASATSRSHPTPLYHEEMNGALSLARLFRGLVLRIGKCQSLTEGGGGREAGWKMSSFTGRSCEPRNVSGGSNPASPFSSLLPPITFPRCPWGVCVYGGCGGRGRGCSYSAHF